MEYSTKLDHAFLWKVMKTNNIYIIITPSIPKWLHRAGPTNLSLTIYSERINIYVSIKFIMNIYVLYLV
jgi:hypothetical protein